MRNSAYAEFRFKRFASETDDFHWEVEKVFSDANDELMAIENAFMDLDDACFDEEIARVNIDVDRVRYETAQALAKLAKAFLGDTPKPPFIPEKKPARDRLIPTDVAIRYIRIYDGRSAWVKTEGKGYAVLIDKDGERRGAISPIFRFPKAT